MIIIVKKEKEIEEIISAIETVKKIMKLQNNIYTRKIKQLEEFMLRGSKIHSNSLIFIAEILKQHNITGVTPKLSLEIGEWNEELKKDLDELSRKIEFDKKEVVELDMNDLKNLLKDLDFILDNMRQ